MTLDRTYRLDVWGEDMSPGTWHQLTEFARKLAGDGVRTAVIDVPLDGEPEFKRETFGHTGEDRVTGDGSPGGTDGGGSPRA